MMGKHPVLSLVREFYQSIDDQQWDLQATYTSTDFVAILGSSLRLLFEIWQEKLKAYYEAFPDGQHFFNFYQVEGDRVLSVGRFAGKHQGAFMGEPATKKQIEMG